MTMHDTGAELRALMDDYGLTRVEVCAMLEVSKSTVDGWLGPAKAPWSRRMHPAHLKLLRALIRRRKRRK